MRHRHLFPIGLLSATFVLGTIVPAGVVAQARANPDNRVPARIGAAPAARAAQAYLKIDGIAGESTARGHERWIEIEAFSVAGARSSARQTLQANSGPGTMTLFPRLENLSPKLIEACNEGRSLGRVVLHIRAPGSSGTFEEYVLDGTTVSTCQASSADERPTENITLNFGKVEFTPPGGDPDRPIIIGR
jgi:type VI protein secretion system component Hcp